MLRKNKIGNQKPWDDQELLAGLLYFYERYGHYPSAHEIDTFEYLPSSRSIQRTQGGLQQLRRRLIPDEIENHTKGPYRKIVASKMYAKGRDLETFFYVYLTSVFKEIAVHEHKLIRPGNVSCDFYVYLSEDSGIVTDVFYADSIKNLVNIVNIKLKRYILINEPTYLVVVGNEAIRQEDIEQKILNKRFPIPKHIQIVTDAYFKKVVVPAIAAQSLYVK